MLTDALVSFIPTQTPLSITTGTQDTTPLDLLGSGQGTQPNIIGNVTLFGTNPGVGLIRPQLEVLVTTAFVGGTSLQVKYQAAPDTATTYVPGSWTTIAETPAIVTASLVAGFRLALWDLFDNVPETLRARWLRLEFVTVGTYTSGAVIAPVTLGRDDWSQKYAANNFVVA